MTDLLAAFARSLARRGFWKGAPPLDDDDMPPEFDLTLNDELRSEYDSRELGPGRLNPYAGRITGPPRVVSVHTLDRPMIVILCVCLCGGFLAAAYVIGRLVVVLVGLFIFGHGQAGLG